MGKRESMGTLGLCICLLPSVTNENLCTVKAVASLLPAQTHEAAWVWSAQAQNHAEKGVLRYMAPSVNKLLWSSPSGGSHGGSVVKNPLGNAGDVSSIPGSGRAPGEGADNPLQYSCLASPMDRGVWQATVHGVAKELDMA